jgi:hypothetical protein
MLKKEFDPTECDLEAEDEHGRWVRTKAKFKTVGGIKKLLTRAGRALPSLGHHP